MKVGADHLLLIHFGDLLLMLIYDENPAFIIQDQHPHRHFPDNMRQETVYKLIVCKRFLIHTIREPLEISCDILWRPAGKELMLNHG